VLQKMQQLQMKAGQGIKTHKLSLSELVQITIILPQLMLAREI